MDKKAVPMGRERLFIEIPGADERRSFKIAYFDSGIGENTVVFVHGFASFSYTWEKMLPFLPEDCRMVRLDLKGYGYSDMSDRENLTPFEQAMILQNFIKALDLRHITLCGHSMGGAISLIALSNPEIRSRVSRLILIDAGGVFKETPEFIQDISVFTEHNPLVRFANEDIMAYVFLRKVYAQEEKITSETANAYAEVLRRDHAKECLIASARQIMLPNLKLFLRDIGQFQIPCLIIWGADDMVIDIEDGYLLNSTLPLSNLKIIQDCGHAPQEEMPEETGHLISEFLLQPGSENGEKIEFVEHFPPAAAAVRETHRRRHHVKLSSMIDKWSFGTLIILLFMKILQLLRKLGMRTSENGWRKATGIFMKKEHSKFVLGSFNLRYYRNQQKPFDYAGAKSLFISRITEFLRKKSNFHWAIEPGFFRLGRRKAVFTDVIEAEFHPDGKLTSLIPHFDKTRDNFPALTPENIASLLEEFIVSYNKLLSHKSQKVAQKLSRHLKTWTLGARGLGFNARLDMYHLIDRVMTATFINFELLPEPSQENFLRKRLSTPNIKIYRHPGWGLLNMLVRFMPDFSEADLWVQYHHVPVDGMPMQELLEELKKNWGSVGKLVYPAMNSTEARPEIFYSGNGLFRARVFVDFSKFLQLRKKLNVEYRNKMSGPATIASMIIWGLCQHPYFRDSKILFPVDIEKGIQYASERELSLVFIRPATYADPENPLEGFVHYQREFNRRLARTRTGRSESYEMLELYSMVHPIFYYIAKYLIPNSLSEFVGTVGLSIMRNAEMFISPLSDLQTKGFMSMSNMRVPTADGGEAGAVSICGSREQISAYIEAISAIANHYETFFETGNNTIHSGKGQS